MDDIIEKLSLLDYKHLFCKTRNHKPISRTYFAIGSSSEEQETKVSHFFDLCYWLMSLIFEDKVRKDHANKKS